MKNFFLLVAVFAGFVTEASAQDTFEGDYTDTPAGHTVGMSFSIVQGGFDVASSKWSYTATINRIAGGVNPHDATLRLRGTAVTVDLSLPINSSASVSTTFVVSPLVVVTNNVEVNYGATVLTAVRGTFTAPPTPPTPKSLVVDLSNPTDIPIDWKFYERDPLTGELAAQPFKTVTVPPGSNALQGINVTNGKDVTVIPSATNAAIDGGGNWVAGSGYVQGPGSTYTNASMSATSSAPGYVPGKVTPANTPGMPTNLNPATAPPLTAGPVTIFPAATTGLATALSNGVFASGVNQLAGTLTANADKNAQGIMAALAALPGGGGGGGSDMSGVESRLDSANEYLGYLQERAEAEKDAIEDGTATAETDAASYIAGIGGKVSGAQGDGAALKSSLEATSLLAGASSIAAVNPIPANNSYALQARPIEAGLLGMVDANPFTSPQLQNILGTGSAVTAGAWVKDIISWCLVVGFLGYVAIQVKEQIYAMIQVRPLELTGSTQIMLRTSVVGNSVGVLPASAMYAASAIAISTLILAAPVIIVGAIGDIGGVAALTSAGAASGSAAGSASGFIADAMSYVYLFFPVALALTVVVNSLLVQVGAIVQFVVTAVVLRILAI